ncbi:hypothetical protein [Nostoc sp.]|uniref:hypothetical protein n=1 Tax=Nostoc sp. TaxID=1180 RepID=UPI002FF5B18E
MFLQSHQRYFNWHLAIDTLGFPFFTHWTRANISDDAGLKEKFTLNIDYFKSKPIDIPKITILLDHGYHPEYLTQELERINPVIITKIQFQLSTKPSKQEKAALGKCGESSGSSQMGDRALQCLDGAL